MSDRVILAVKFTPAGASSQVSRAVGGFLRYVQHRDVHTAQRVGHSKPQVSGLLKYVAYRDRAGHRAELFGPRGALTSADRNAFATFVGEALDQSKPQSFRGRDGNLHDRRRAVYRLVISPERADGLDLRQLAGSAVGRLEQESGISGLRWIAAIHRNTAHHHVHLVIAGMHRDSSGAYRRVDLTKQRLAAMKEELSNEIARQRPERTPINQVPATPAQAPVHRTAPRRAVEAAPGQALAQVDPPTRTRERRSISTYGGSLIALRGLARRYQRRMERELEETNRRQMEHAA